MIEHRPQETPAIAPPRGSPGLPPGPSSPAWWLLVRFAGDLLRLLDEGHRWFGDAFSLNVAGHGRFVMLTGAEDGVPSGEAG